MTPFSFKCRTNPVVNLPRNRPATLQDSPTTPRNKNRTRHTRPTLLPATAQMPAATTQTTTLTLCRLWHRNRHARRPSQPMIPFRDTPDLSNRQPTPSGTASKRGDSYTTTATPAGSRINNSLRINFPYNQYNGKIKKIKGDILVYFFAL